MKWPLNKRWSDHWIKDQDTKTKTKHKNKHKHKTKININTSLNKQRQKHKQTFLPQISLNITEYHWISLRISLNITESWNNELLINKKIVLYCIVFHCIVLYWSIPPQCCPQCCPRTGPIPLSECVCLSATLSVVCTYVPAATLSELDRFSHLDQTIYWAGLSIYPKPASL